MQLLFFSLHWSSSFTLKIFSIMGVHLINLLPGRLVDSGKLNILFFKILMIPTKKGFVTTYITVSLIFDWSAKICISHKLWIIYEFGSTLASGPLEHKCYGFLTPLSTIFQLYPIMVISFIDGENQCPTATHWLTLFK